MKYFFESGRRIPVMIILNWIGIAVVTTGVSACTQKPDIEAGSKAGDKGVLKDEEVWQVIYVNDLRVGYAYSQTRIGEQSGEKVIRTQNDSYLKIKRFGQLLNIGTHSQTTETTDGDLLSYSFELKNPPADSTISKGVVKKGQLEIETRIAGQVNQSRLKWKPEFHSPSYLDRYFKESPMKPGEKKTFSMLLPEYNKITEVTLSALDFETVELAGGKQEKCLHVQMERSLLPGVVFDLYVSESGEIPKTASDFLGSTMLTYIVSKEDALKEISGKELDLAVQTLIKVKSIPRAHESGKAVYQLTLKDGDPSEFLAQGDTQQVKKLNEKSAELTVVKAAVPAQFSKNKVDPEYLNPTQFIQSDDPQIIKYAADAVQAEKNPWNKATLMERYVYRNMRKKNFSTALASASEVAKKMEGDCTEHAILLAAMLRAQNLPSRVVVGMVYIPSRSSFGGHMWTEVFLDNRWIPLDATLGRGGIGGGHIKISDSSLADNAPAPLTIFIPLLQVVGKLSIEVVDIVPHSAR